MRSFNNSTRVLKNQVAEQILELEKEKADFKKIAPLAGGERTRKMFRENGNPNDSMWSCGQAVGLISDIPTIKDLIERIVKEAIEKLQAASAKIKYISKI